MEEKTLVKYQDGKGQEIVLSEEIVRKYLVQGNGKVTNQEIMMFLALCKYQKLNPFLREIYLIKYSDTLPASMVTGKETFLKRAIHNPKYQGHETGISEDGKKAWAKVYVAGYQVPIACEVDYIEYVGKNREGQINKMWREKPKTMLKKVALVQALREAFPEDFGGMYSVEEINAVQEETLPKNEVVITEEFDEMSQQPKNDEKIIDPDISIEELKPEELKPPKESYQKRIGDLMREMYGNDISAMQQKLLQLTSFVNKEGKEIIGVISLKELSDKQAKVAFCKLREEIEKEKNK